MLLGLAQVGVSGVRLVVKRVEARGRVGRGTQARYSRRLFRRVLNTAVCRRKQVRGRRTSRQLEMNLRQAVGAEGWCVFDKADNRGIL